MQLTVVHQVLISGAILTDIAYALRAGVRFGQGHGTAELVKMLIAIGVAVAMGLYLKRFRGKLRAAGESNADA